MQAAFDRIGIVDNNPDILSLDEPTSGQLVEFTVCRFIAGHRQERSHGGGYHSPAKFSVARLL